MNQGGTQGAAREERELPVKIVDHRFKITRFAFRVNGSIEAAKLGFSPGERDAGLQTCEYADQHLVLARLEVRAEQDPGLRLCGVKAEPGGHDTEHGTWLLIEREALADDGGVAVQCSLPEFVGEQDGAAVSFIFAAEGAAQCRGNAERVEQ